MIHLVRHGRTEANAGGRLQGRLDLPIDACGQEQAAAHVFTSACVFINGALVGAFIVGIFQFLVKFIDLAAAW